MDYVSNFITLFLLINLYVYDGKHTFVNSGTYLPILYSYTVMVSSATGVLVADDIVTYRTFTPWKCFPFGPRASRSFQKPTHEWKFIHSKYLSWYSMRTKTFFWLQLLTCNIALMVFITILCPRFHTIFLKLFAQMLQRRT